MWCTGCSSLKSDFSFSLVIQHKSCSQWSLILFSVDRAAPLHASVYCFDIVCKIIQSRVFEGIQIYEYRVCSDLILFESSLMWVSWFCNKMGSFISRSKCRMLVLNVALTWIEVTSTFAWLTLRLCSDEPAYKGQRNQSNESFSLSRSPSFFLFFNNVPLSHWVIGKSCCLISVLTLWNLFTHR